MKKIGILGAGKVGIVLAQLALKAGYEVIIANSGPASQIALTIEVLAPGAVASDALGVAKEADIVILALPLSKYSSIDAESLANKVVIDAMNYWWEVDGIQDKFTNPLQATSELIQDYLNQSIVIKAFNHMGYHDIYDESRIDRLGDRKAIAVAGDHKQAINDVMEIVKNLGFDPINIGSLAESIKLEPGSAAFGANVSKDELGYMINHFYESERGQMIIQACKNK